MLQGIFVVVYLLFIVALLKVKKDPEFTKHQADCRILQTAQNCVIEILEEL